MNNTSTLTPARAATLIKGAITRRDDYREIIAHIVDAAAAADYIAYNPTAAKLYTPTVDAVLDSADARAIYHTAAAVRVYDFLKIIEDSADVIAAECNNVAADAENDVTADDARAAVLDMTDAAKAAYAIIHKRVDTTAATAARDTAAAAAAMLALHADAAEIAFYTPTAYDAAKAISAVIMPKDDEQMLDANEIVKTVKNNMLDVFKLYAAGVYVNKAAARAVITTCGKLSKVDKAHKEVNAIKPAAHIAAAILNEFTVKLTVKRYVDRAAADAAARAERDQLETAKTALVEKAKADADDKARKTTIKRKTAKTDKPAAKTDKPADKTDKPADKTDKTDKPAA